MNQESVKKMIDYYEDSIIKYFKQKLEIEELKSSEQIDNLLIDLTDLKKTLLPSPLRCLNTLSDCLPKIAREMNEFFLNSVNNSVKILGSIPSNVESTVLYLEHFGKVKEELELIHESHSHVIRVYNLLQKYSITILPTDLAMFQTLYPTMRQLNEALEKSEDLHDEYVQKLSVELEKEIQATVTRVVEIRNRSQDPLILNPNSNIGEVLEFISSLRNQFDTLNSVYMKFISYQNQFKLPTSKKIEFEETNSELDMKKVKSC